MTPHEKQTIQGKYRKQREQVYAPLLKQFILENSQNLEESRYWYGPFIPYAFPSYGIDGEKYFYIGLDTFYWDTTPDDLRKCLAIDDFDYFLRKNDDTVTTSRILIEWYKGKGAFWQFVCKLHLFLRTGVIKSTEDLRHLSLDEVAMIDEIGYGNYNAIETYKTLEKEEFWKEISGEEYQAVKNAYESLRSSAAKTLDKLRNLLNSYEPDYAVILTSEVDEESYFEGLEYSVYQDIEAFDGRLTIRLYTIKGRSTKVIRLCHPSRFKFLSTNDEEMVEYTANAMKEFK
jgi:hypothetical protein